MSRPCNSARMAAHRLAKMCNNRKANKSLTLYVELRHTTNFKDENKVVQNHLDRNSMDELHESNHKALTQNHRKTIFVQKHFTQENCPNTNPVEIEIDERAHLLEAVSSDMDLIKTGLLLCKKLGQAYGNNNPVQLNWEDLLSLSLSTTNELCIS